MTKKFLFCDVDETLISIKSMFSFHDYWFKNCLPLHAVERSTEYDDINAIMLALNRRGATREELNRRYYEFFAGRPVADVKRCAEQWFADTTADTPEFWVPEVCSELRRLTAAGYEPVLVSGSLTEILQPIARALEVKHVLATRLVLSGDRYNGRIIPPQTIGAGKAAAVTQFLLEHGTNAKDCCAMGDDVSDIPMLESVGHPIAVVGDPKLRAEANARGWPCIVLEPALIAA